MAKDFALGPLENPTGALIPPDDRTIEVEPNNGIIDGALDDLTPPLLAGLQSPFRTNLFRRLDNNGHDPDRSSMLTDDGGVVQFHPYRLGCTRSVQRQLLVGIAEGLPRKPDANDVIVKGGNFGPAFPDLRSEQIRMALTAKVE